uniref:Uncharacterized protein n=1 Tax=Manihot esculenta TaxID=3983 RepID=A0A2C9W0Q0_MANES
MSYESKHSGKALFTNSCYTLLLLQLYYFSRMIL